MSDTQDNDDASHVSSKSSSKHVNNKWTREEIEDLYDMSSSGYTITEMCRDLRRSRYNVIRALKRIQTQQAIFNNIHEVANAHNVDANQLERRLKDPLYYIPLKHDEVFPIIVISSVLFGLISMYGYVYYSP